MNDFIRYEIKAEAFRLSTGFMAPGKDVAAAANEGEEARLERDEAWAAWCSVNNLMFDRFIKAAEYVGVE